MPFGALLAAAPVAVPVADVWLSVQTMADVRIGSRAAVLDAAERVARQLEPLLWQAATGRLSRAQDTPARSKPRRSRAQVLAGLKAGGEARTAARLAYTQGQARADRS